MIARIDNALPTLSPQVWRAVRRKARQLVGRAGFRPMDREDIEQDLWVDLLVRWRQFDSAKAGGRTFATRVVEHQAATLLRKSRTTVESERRRQRSLEETVRDGDGRPVPMAQVLDGRAHAARTGSHSLTPNCQSDLADDVAGALADLPEDLRDLCQRLKQGSITQIAKDMGIARASLYRRMEKIRAHFVATGLSEYFGIRADTSRAD